MAEKSTQSQGDKTMFRNIIVAGAAAITLCLAATAASTSASAAPGFAGFRGPTGAFAGHAHRHIGTGGFAARPGGGQARCWFSACTGGTRPESFYHLRQCDMTPAGHPPPPWCQNAGGSRGAIRALRR
jgi:hypothetical protein